MSTKVQKLGRVVEKISNRLELALEEGKGSIARDLSVADAFKLRKVIVLLCNEEYKKANQMLWSLETDVKDSIWFVMTDLLQDVVDEMSLKSK